MVPGTRPSGVPGAGGGGLWGSTAAATSARAGRDAPHAGLAGRAHEAGSTGRRWRGPGTARRAAQQAGGGTPGAPMRARAADRRTVEAAWGGRESRCVRLAPTRDVCGAGAWRAAAPGSWQLWPARPARPGPTSRRRPITAPGRGATATCLGRAIPTPSRRSSAQRRPAVIKGLPLPPRQHHVLACPQLPTAPSTASMSSCRFVLPAGAPRARAHAGLSQRASICVHLRPSAPCPHAGRLTPWRQLPSTWRWAPMCAAPIATTSSFVSTSAHPATNL